MSDPSALQASRANGSADLLSVLADLLLRLDVEPVILLRPLTSNFDSRKDDVDLLLTEHQRTSLLGAAFEASITGKLHIRVRQRTAEKVQLILWNVECTSSLTIDLWSAFSQLPGHHGKMIRADRLLRSPAAIGSCRQRPSVSSELPIPATIRLPADIDFCLLVLHLVAKKKRFANSVVRDRLLMAFDRLRTLALDETDALSSHRDAAILLQAAEPILDSWTIPPELVRVAEAYVLRRIGDSAVDSSDPVLVSRKNRNPVVRFRSWLMKRVPCLAIVGSDGAGKSSVCHCLAVSVQSDMSQRVSRKLYRRSLLYQLLSGVAKRIAGTDRGQFDDQVAPWITLRASASLWLRVTLKVAAAAGGLRIEPRTATTVRPMLATLRSRETLLLDRSVSSFLIRYRKTDTPQLHWSARMIEQAIPPVTTVLLTVPFEQLKERRLEMTCHGHQNYQRMLFQQALRQQPSDVIVIASTQTAADAAEFVRLINDDHIPATVSVGQEAA